MRVSKIDAPRTIGLQSDALIAAGVAKDHIYKDGASNKHDARPGLDAALKILKKGETLVVWKLDRLGRNLRHMIHTVHDLARRGIGLKVLSGNGAAIGTTTPADKLVFGIFAALASFERELHSERTKAGQALARALGRTGGAPYKMTVGKLQLAMAAMGQSDTNVGDLCNEIGITRQTLYRHIAPDGTLRNHGQKLLAKKRNYACNLY